MIKIIIKIVKIIIILHHNNNIQQKDNIYNIEKNNKIDYDDR